MKRILLRLSFDGTAYHGWQIQPNAVTVQSVLQESLKKLLGSATPVTGCSRTDAGVHASEFCAHIDCKDSIPKEAFLLGLNSILPPDISVFDCEQVSSDFHARYSCRKKEYIYNFYTGIKNPFKSRYAVHISTLPDMNAAEAVCRSIIGTHDFVSFSGSKRSVESTVRTVYDCTFEKTGSDYRLTVSADGFLYNMVRIIVGTVYEAGIGLKNTECANEAFKTNDRTRLGTTFPPQGLFLNKVYY